MKVEFAVNEAELRAIDGRRKGRSRSAYIRNLAVHGNESSLRVRREVSEELAAIRESIAAIRSDYIVGEIVADDLDRIDKATDTIQAVLAGRQRPR